MENARLVQEKENLVQENETFRGDLEQAEVHVASLSDAHLRLLRLNFKVNPNPRP